MCGSQSFPRIIVGEKRTFAYIKEIRMEGSSTLRVARDDGPTTSATHAAVAYALPVQPATVVGLPVGAATVPMWERRSMPVSRRWASR